MNPLMCFKVPGQEDLEELKEQEQQQQEQEQQLLQDHSDVEEDSEMNNYATEYSADKRPHEDDSDDEDENDPRPQRMRRKFCYGFLKNFKMTWLGLS